MIIPLKPHGDDWQKIASTAGRGDVLEFTGEQYAITQTFKVNRGVTVRGNGSTLLAQLTDATKPAMLLQSQVCLIDFVLLNAAGQSGIVCEAGSSSQVVERVQVSGFDPCVNLAQCWCQSWRSCCLGGDLTKVAVRLGIANTNGITFTGCRIEGNRIGFLFENPGESWGVVMRDCTIESHEECGIRVAGAVGNLVVHGCYFEQNSQADLIVDYPRAESVSIRNCVTIHGGGPLDTKRFVWVKRGNGTRIGPNLVYTIPPFVIEHDALNTIIETDRFPTAGGLNQSAKNYSPSTVMATSKIAPVSRPGAPTP